MKFHRLLKCDGGAHPVERTPHVATAGLISFGVDVFALDAGWHNGPRCVDCGMALCHHCHPYWWRGECKGEDGHVEVV